MTEKQILPIKINIIRCFSRHLFFISNITVFLWFLLLTLYLGKQRIFPYLYDDEYGVLGAAAVFAGLDWTTPPEMPFYGFVLSLLISPFYKLNLEPTLLYRIALSINGLLVALSAFMALHILRRLFQGMTELSRVLIVVAAFSYPSVIFYAGLALGETTLLFAFTLILYSLVLIFDQQRNILGVILLAIGLGIAPYAHPRGLAFWLAAAPILLWLFANQWLRRKLLAIFLIVFLPVFATLASVKSWLIDNFYSVLRAGTGSASEFASTKIMAAFSSERWADLALTAYGQFAYLVSASFGLAIVGFIGITVVLKSIYFPFEKKPALLKKDPTRDAQLAVASFLVFSFFIMFSLSVISLASGNRVDHVFYGRYNEILVPSLIMAGLVFLFSPTIGGRLRRLMWASTGLGIAVFLVLGIQAFPDEVFKREMIWNSLSGWFMHIQEEWRVEAIWIALGTLYGGLLLLFALTFSRRGLAVVLSCVFMAGIFHNYSGQHGGADRGWGEYGKFGARYNKIFKEQQIDLISDNRRLAGAGEALQFSLPDSQVRFVPSERSIVVFDTSGAHCDDMNTAARIGQARLCVHDPVLLASIKSISRGMEVLSDARSAPPARFEIKAKKIETGGLMSRACAFMAPFFYTSWARYCLPSVAVNVKREGLTGHERQQLGIFISDQSNRWFNEWRASLDTTALTWGETVTVRIPVRFPANLPSGDYRLYVVFLDEKGWDWRSKASLALRVK